MSLPPYLCDPLLSLCGGIEARVIIVSGRAARVERIDFGVEGRLCDVAFEVVGAGEVLSAAVRVLASEVFDDDVAMGHKSTQEVSVLEFRY